MAETTNEFEDPSGDDQTLFTCGLCENMLDKDEFISKHKCLQAYSYFYVADNYVYPVEARSKKVVSNQGNLCKEQEEIGDLCLDQEIFVQQTSENNFHTLNSPT